MSEGSARQHTDGRVNPAIESRTLHANQLFSENQISGASSLPKLLRILVRHDDSKFRLNARFQGVYSPYSVCNERVVPLKMDS
jgi:hypothetical protein